MLNAALVSTVNSVLGKGKETSGNNYAYQCPFCQHHKPKLEVNLVPNSKGENFWHCWVCNAKGKSLLGLFKKLKVPQDKILELRSILNYTDKKDEEESDITKIELPKEYKSLLSIQRTDISAKHALAYLKKRGISKEDILKYNIGFCEEGRYKNMIVVPSYNKDGLINYFIARSFEKDPSRKYDSPKCNKNAIIGLEYFINWNIPIILCEGPFDALAIKRNVIPLLGKNIQQNLRKKLVTSKVQKIYIALDKDAIKQALSFCEELINEGKEVYLVDMQDKDPGEMGFENFTNLIQHTVPLTFSSLFEKKLQLV